MTHRSRLPSVHSHHPPYFLPPSFFVHLNRSYSEMQFFLLLFVEKLHFVTISMPEVILMNTTEIFSLDETALAAGVSYATLMYHRRLGALPEPGRWGGRRVYDREQYEAVTEYFAARIEYQRKLATTKGTTR